MNTFTPLHTQAALPTTFPDPFNAPPAQVAMDAAKDLQQRLQLPAHHKPHSRHDGQTFAVLVVKNTNGNLGYLAAHTLPLEQQAQAPSFAEAEFSGVVFVEPGIVASGTPSPNKEKPHISEQTRHEKMLSALNDELAVIQQDAKRALTALKAEHRSHKAKRAQQRVAFDTRDIEHTQQIAQLAAQSQHDRLQYKQCRQHWQQKITACEQALLAQQQLIKSHQQGLASHTVYNARSEQQSLSEIFAGPAIPTGTGNCVAAKLLQHAFRHQYQAIALAEFFWGSSNHDALRRHGHYYPPRRSQRPLLSFMLQGLNIAQHTPIGHYPEQNAPEVIYEDDDLIVINKPAGLLSVPGKDISDSVLTRLQARYPHATGPLLLHRLDMCTSGIMLAAKHPAAHKALQQQFLQRSISKRYLALLDHQYRTTPIADSGSIELPLRVDLDDRPRQLVCDQHGKPARSHWQVLERHGSSSRVYFFPITGRTHQLRVHAAHPAGLNSPIVGDTLYGSAAARLMLHAEHISFNHPSSGKRLTLQATAPF